MLGVEHGALSRLSMYSMDASLPHYSLLVDAKAKVFGNNGQSQELLTPPDAW